MPIEARGGVVVSMGLLLRCCGVVFADYSDAWISILSPGLSIGDFAARLPTVHAFRSYVDASEPTVFDLGINLKKPRRLAATSTAFTRSR